MRRSTRASWRRAVSARPRQVPRGRSHGAALARTTRRFTVKPIKKTWHRVRPAKMAFIDGVEGENTIMHMSNTLPEFRIAAPSNWIEEYLLGAGRCAHPPAHAVLSRTVRRRLRRHGLIGCAKRTPGAARTRHGTARRSTLGCGCPTCLELLFGALRRWLTIATGRTAG